MKSVFSVSRNLMDFKIQMNTVLQDLENHTKCLIDSLDWYYYGYPHYDSDSSLQYIILIHDNDDVRYNWDVIHPTEFQGVNRINNVRQSKSVYETNVS
jgi:hypothetical protein